MDIFTIAFWIIAIVLTVISFIKDKNANCKCKLDTPW